MQFKHVAWAGVGLTLCVVVLGAFVRLSDAGLGCPDWPGCYGHLAWPTEAQAIEKANEAFPERAVEVDKAWKEMVHRYLAGILGLVVLGLFVSGPFRERHLRSYGLPLVLCFVIVFQAALGHVDRDAEAASQHRDESPHGGLVNLVVDDLVGLFTH